MNIVEIVSYYPVYIKKIYSSNPSLKSKSYDEQMSFLNHDSAGWADFWQRALKPLGYNMYKIILNATSLQKAWARENSLNVPSDNFDYNSIAFEQVKLIKPDIIFYNHYDASFLAAIKKEIASVKLVLVWVGSAIPESSVWKDVDIILSCAPETVDFFKSKGHKQVYHLNHGFDPIINERLKGTDIINNRYQLSFIGQLTRQGDFHLYRDELLKQLAGALDISIFSPTVESYSFLSDLDFLIRKYSYKLMNTFKKAGISKNMLAKIPKLGKAALWETEPLEPINPFLKKHIQPGVFGLQMYRVFKESLVTLNIHADSSPRYASNMRLFEATGVGCCLLTDWRDNICQLFRPETEVITYKSSDECIEKMRWLLNNPAEAKKIAAAGMKRCLLEHTFSKRAEKLDEYIKKAMK